jgi:hypothetical protein
MLSASGLPTGTTASFSPATVTGAGSSTLTVTTAGSTPAGTSTLTLKGVNGSATYLSLVFLLTVMVCWKQRQQRVQPRAWALPGAILLFVAFCVGCSGGANSSPRQGTPPGTYRITVTATATGISHTVVVNLTVR